MTSALSLSSSGHLSCTRCPIICADAGAELLTAGLCKASRSLTALYLQANGIGVRGSCALASAISALYTLRHIDLSSNEVCGVAPDSAVALTAERGTYSTEGLMALAKAVSGGLKNGARRTLILDDNLMGTLGMRALADVWLEATTERALEAIRCDSVTLPTCEATEIDLHGKQLGPAGVLLLAAALKCRDNRALVQLDLRANALGQLVEQGVSRSEVGAALAMAVQGEALPALLRFWIGGNGLGSAAVLKVCNCSQLHAFHRKGTTPRIIHDYPNMCTLSLLRNTGSLRAHKTRRERRVATAQRRPERQWHRRVGRG